MARRALALAAPQLFRDTQVQLLTVATPAQLPPPMLLPSAALAYAQLRQRTSTVPHVAVAGGFIDWQVPELAVLGTVRWI